MDSAPESTSETPAADVSDRPFPIVGVGSSAGGLEALIELLRPLPADPGFALVVVQHLDPTRPSSLVDLLARVSQIPVQEVVDKTPVEVNHVYVIPPTADLIMRDGGLHLISRIGGRLPHFPIDTFLQSLAEQRTEHAVGVILSGTGSDGTLGLKAIRGVGGCTFAQDSTAQYEDMPKSAVAAGWVDAVLPPKEIATALLQVTNYSPTPPEAVPSESEALRGLLQTVRTVTGVDFTAYKSETVTRRVQRRMVLHRLDRIADYARFVADHPDETRALFEDMLIHVTSFFRDPKSFEALRDDVFPKLLANRSTDSPIRIWVPGCSTGEELYSLAIVLIEFLSDRVSPTLKFFGTDLSELALETARAGRYPVNIAEDVSPERLRRFFVLADGGYQINKMVRELCVFARHDVTCDPPFSNMDLVSCLNLLIYLSPEAQNRVLPLLHYSLKPTGQLLLGAAETVSLLSELFVPLNLQHRIYSRKPIATRALLDFSPPDIALARSTSAGYRMVARNSDVVQEADRLLLAHYSPPGVLVNDNLDVVQFRGDTSPFLELAPGIASLALMRLARNWLQIPLRMLFDELKSGQTEVRKRGVRYEIDDQTRVVDLKMLVFNMPPASLRYYLILFEDATPPATTATFANVLPASNSIQSDRLKEELASTRSSMQSVIEELEAHNEELQASNEEVVSANEELRSTNEELQTAKEELQATNEELGTVNDELNHRNRVVMALSDDLANLLASAHIPIVMIGQDHRIRRFTPSAAKLFNLIPADVGRPLEDMKSQLDIVDLDRLIDEVLDSMSTKEREVRDRSGRWYILYVRPCRTQDKQIDGVVLTLIDVDALKRVEQVIATSRDFSLSVIESARHPLVTLDASVRVVSANPAFYKTFRVTRSTTEGRLFSELGHGQWDIPELLQVLGSILPGAAVLENFEFTHQFPEIGRRTMLLNASRMVWPNSGQSDYILLTIEDITDQKLAEAAVKDREARLQAILDTATDTIITIDERGVIATANQAIERMFGYSSQELIGQNVAILMPASFQNPQEDLARYATLGEQWKVRSAHEVQGRRKDGTFFPAELAMSEVSQERRWYTSVIRDISVRKQLEREVLESSAEEERRIGRELHDGVGQELTGLGLMADALRRRLDEGEVTTRDLAEKLVVGVQSVQDNIRNLCRDMVLAEVDTEGLRSALEHLGVRTQEQAGITCTFDCPVAVSSLDPNTARHLYRIAQEAVNNALRHGRPKQIRLGLKIDEHELQLSVEDDGVGFEEVNVNADGTGLGIATMRYRANLIGGTLRVEPGKERGVVVTCTVPLETSDVGQTSKDR